MAWTTRVSMAVDAVYGAAIRRIAPGISAGPVGSGLMMGYHYSVDELDLGFTGRGWDNKMCPTAPGHSNPRKQRSQSAAEVVGQNIP